jgi:hypothetical protein
MGNAPRRSLWTTTMSTETAMPEREILDAVRSIRYGSVEVVIHDSRVVQVTRTEKIRLEPNSRSAPQADRGGR